MRAELRGIIKNGLLRVCNHGHNQDKNYIISRTISQFRLLKAGLPTATLSMIDSECIAAFDDMVDNGEIVFRGKEFVYAGMPMCYPTLRSGYCI